MNNVALSEQPVSVSFAKTKSLRLHRATEDSEAANHALISAQGLHKAYRRGPLSVSVLKGVDFHARSGAITAIVGQSGSGKSTLLHLLATLDRPDEGEVHFEGKRIDNVSRQQRDTLRNRDIGMIFQFYHLLPELTMLENVMMPCMIGYNMWQYLRYRGELKRRAEELLNLVGLSHRMHHRPRELSGGEMQRTAIARALVAKPKLLLADEPTGNLDRETGEGIMQLLEFLNQRHKLTIVMVTHDEKVAARCDHVVSLVEGRVESLT
jgi:lipoprotein-releasing system ATP-binding protein